MSRLIVYLTESKSESRLQLTDFYILISVGHAAICNDRDDLQTKIKSIYKIKKRTKLSRRVRPFNLKIGYCF